MKAPALLRSFTRAPMFAVVVIVLVASVVAVNASTFSAIHALHWKALPYADDNALLEMRGDMQKFGFVTGLNGRIRDALQADHAHFSGVLGFTKAGREHIDVAGKSWRLIEVTPGFEQVLGVAPALGRSLLGGEAIEGENQVVVISNRAWHQRFNADPDVIGRVIDFGKMKLAVIGVMPPGFAFPDSRIDAWRTYVAGDEDDSFGDLEVVARVTPGTSIAQARKVLTSLISNDKPIARLKASANIQANVRSWRERYSTGHEQALDLLQMAGLVFLIVAVANLINLNLDRLLVRRREFAIRRSLGASERDIAWNVAADVLPPVLIGLALGLVLTPFGLHVLADFSLLPEFLPQYPTFGPAAIIGGCVATALIVATVLLAAWLVQWQQGLSNRSDIAGMGRLRPALLVGQLMLTTILLGVSTLLLRSAINLVSSEHGFSEQGVLMTRIDPLGVSVDNAVYDPKTDSPRLLAIMEQIRAQVASLPGVDRVAFADAPPFTSSSSITKVRIPGVVDAQSVDALLVSSGYMETLGIGLMSGRDFVAADLGNAAAVIVDETYQKRYLQGVDPLKSFVELSESRDGIYNSKARIIGVVPAIKYKTLDEASSLPMVYQHVEAPMPSAYLLTHTTGNVHQLAHTVRRRILDIEPSTVISFNKPLSDSLAETLAPRRALLELIAGFGLATLLMASTGLAAVLNFSVRRRATELGVRMAMGATASRIRNLVLRQGVVLVAIGGLLGLLVGVPLARSLDDRLYQIACTDLASWLAALTCVSVVTVLACWLPARRAAATDPIEALRNE